ncbi:hypothetical protein MKEN_01052200 [Mycena kentingensis (nom. inval.)]|nr:hypothetical protein MKEN_01052200 [Mycena kentingensis (nom. inval.)]
MDRPATLYFGYGSNLWIEQMNTRCLENKLWGVARLDDWSAFALKNTILGPQKSNFSDYPLGELPGASSVVPSPAAGAGDHVYGLLYELNAHDEATLDRCEAVPRSYQKHLNPVSLLNAASAGLQAVEMLDVLVYVDRANPDEGLPRTEYIHRINNGIVDLVAAGVPQAYVDKYLRPYIPANPGTPPFSSAVDAGLLSKALNHLPES